MIELQRTGNTNSSEYIFFNQMSQKYTSGLSMDPTDLFQFRHLLYNPLLQFLNSNGRNLQPQYRELIEITTAANQSLTPIIRNIEKRGSEAKQLSDSINITLQKINSKRENLSSIAQVKSKYRNL